VNKQTQTVSISEKGRLNHAGQNNMPAPAAKKEFRKMIGQWIAALAMIATLLAGTGAATVYASQASLPGDVLYPVKTWSEDVQIDWTTDPESKLDLSMEFTDRRLDEIEQLISSGVAVEDSVLLGLENDLDSTLAYLSQIPDAGKMEGVVTHMMTQQQIMEKALGVQDDPLKLQIQAMLQTRIQAVEKVQDQFEIQNQNQQQQQTPGPKESLQQQQQLQSQSTLTPEATQGNSTQPAAKNNGIMPTEKQNEMMPAENGNGSIPQGSTQNDPPMSESNGNGQQALKTPNGSQPENGGGRKP
jgi:hypothetical protein